MLEGYNEWDVDLHTLHILVWLLTKFQSQTICLLVLPMFQAKKIRCYALVLSYSCEMDKFLYLFNKHLLNAYYVLGIILLPYSTVINKIPVTNKVNEISDV